MSFISFHTVRAKFCFVFVMFLYLPALSNANGSARLIEPAMRSSLWRFNPKATVNLNDQALDCGGPQIQFNLNRGRCGVCGDPYHERRENERGGKYDTGIIARKYRTGSKVTMIADLVGGNGGGYFEVKLCARNNPRAKITQSCFDKYPLKIKNGKRRRLEIPENTRNPTGLYRLDVKLPKGVTCTHCVLQWHYHASNEWGYDSNGRGCMGCGPQTEIYNCADVTIGYYGDAEGKLGQTADLSVGALAEVYNTYANGPYGTGVSSLIVNSGINQGWASANDLTRTTTSKNNENENDDDQQTMARSFNRQSTGFANLFLREGGANDYMMSGTDYYNSYDDYGLSLDMMPLMGLGGGGGGESGEGNNFARASFNMRTFRPGGGSGSSEEGGGGMNFRRSFAMDIPSLTRQYNAMNGGGSSEEQSGGRMMNRVNIDTGDRQNTFLRLRDALKDIANRQNLRNGLHDIVEELANRNNGRNNNYDDYYYNNRGGGSSSSEGYSPRNVPTYFRGGGGSSDSSDCSSEEGGCGRRVVIFDRVPEVEGPGPEVIDYYDDYTTPKPAPTTLAPTTPAPTEEVVTTPADNGPNRGDSINDLPGGGGVVDYGNYPDNLGRDYFTPEDLDLIARRQAEFDRWKENEEREKLMRMSERANSWKPPLLPQWPYNNYLTGNLFPQQTNPYGMYNPGLNMNPNLTPAIPTLSRPYPTWQTPNVLPDMTTPSRLSRAFPANGYTTKESSSSQIFSWMPSPNDVMTLGSSMSPIFSQKIANQYLSPFLTLSQSHPALRCQKPDQLVCVATPNYRNIPDADSICTTKCRSGGACGSDYCSCACQKSLVCYHQSSQNALGQMGVTELDMWCTEQCNAGQCPNQVCACNMLF